MPAASSIKEQGLLENDSVAHFVMLPSSCGNEVMLERPLKIFAALLRQRDKYATRSTWLDAMKVDNIKPQKIDSPSTTRSTWLAQEALRGMKVATPSLIGSRCLPSLVTA